MVSVENNTTSEEWERGSFVPNSAKTCSFEEGLRNREKFTKAVRPVEMEPSRPDFTEVDEAVRFVIEHYRPKEIIVFGQSAKGFVGDNGVEMLIVKNYRSLLGAITKISSDLIVQTEINSTISLISVAEYKSMSLRYDSILNNDLSHGYVAYADW